MEDTSQTGANIRAVRRRKGLTQEELAKMTGISVMSIRRYEKGERIITDETVMKIANALDIEWQKLKGCVFWGYNGDGFEIWGPPDSITELDQIFADNIIQHDGQCKQISNRINVALEKLNDEGRQEAAKRVEELTEICRYQAQPPAEAPPAPPGDTDTPAVQDAPERPQEDE